MLISVNGGKFHKMAGVFDRAKAFRSADTVCGLTVTPFNYFEDAKAADSYTGGRLQTYLCKHCAAKGSAS
jgi:hypothetical protein